MKNERDFKSLYKFKTIDQYLYQILLDSEIYFSGRHKLNDANEAILRFTKQQVISDDPFGQFDLVDLAEPHFTAIDNYFFFCMTRNAKSIPLWGYYGDNHRGVCLEFDFSVAIPQWLDDSSKPWKIETNPEIPFVDDVRYQDRLDGFTLAPDGHPNLSVDDSDLFGFKKLKCWEHEAEVRMRLCRNPAKPNEIPPQGIPWKIEKSWLKSVYFGLRTDQKAKNQIVALANSTDFDCQFYEGYDIVIEAGQPIVAFRPYHRSSP